MWKPVKSLGKEHILLNFKCIISNQPSEGRINFERNTYFLCQNTNNGAWCEDRLGYEYSYHVGDGSESRILGEYVRDLHVFFPDQDWDDKENS